MNRREKREKLLVFLKTICRSGALLESVDDGESLVQSGFMDSLATLEIINFLETEFAVDLLATGADPAQLDSINIILDIIEEAAP